MALTHLCVLIMEKCAFRLRQGIVVVLPVAIVFSCAHQSLLLSNCFLLEDSPHEVPFVHRGPDDFQVVRVDDYLPKIYNRWRLEKQRVGISCHQTQGGRSCPMPFPIGEKGLAPTQTLIHPTPRLLSKVCLFFLKVRRVPFLLAEDGNQGRLDHSEGRTIEIRVQSICSHCPPGQPVQSWGHAKGFFCLI